MCDHLHEQTSRYDRSRRMLSFLLVCPVCETERVVETLEYEPRFRPCLVPAPKKPSFPDLGATELLRLAA
jgi:hypothetical protein